MQLHWNAREASAWLLQSHDGKSLRSFVAGGADTVCTGNVIQELTGCRADSLHALALMIFLCSAIIAIIFAFAFFREDKEEQITPLCPQMVVREWESHWVLPLETQADSMAITDPDGKIRCKVITDWPDPFRPSSNGIAASVHLQSDSGELLATVVARNVSMQGQGIALCKAGCEIFGFVEPDTSSHPRRYYVRHRSGLHLLTLIGDFGAMDVDAVNHVGSVVASFKKDGADCHGRTTQHVDAGLIICSLMAARVHRRLSMSPACTRPPTTSQDEIMETHLEEAKSLMDARQESVDAAQAPSS